MIAQECPFCAIVRGELPAVVLYEDEALVAFLDRGPIRPGHTQVIPKVHLPYFEDLPPELASRIVACAQVLARRMKATVGVEGVAFAFTGGDVPHVGRSAWERSADRSGAGKLHVAADGGGHVVGLCTSMRYRTIKGASPMYEQSLQLNMGVRWRP